ncbi:hypothetical protein MKW98_021410, partial [Papaver atlanticum]
EELEDIFGGGVGGSLLIGVEDIKQLDLQREDGYLIVAWKYRQGSGMDNS